MRTRVTPARPRSPFPRPARAATAAADGTAEEPDAPPSLRGGLTQPAQALRWTFHRTHLGFDEDTPQRAYSDVVGELRLLSRSPRTVLRWLGAPGLPFWLACLALALLIAAGLLIETVRPRYWRASWTVLRRLVRRNPPALVLLDLARRVLLPGTALLLWTIGMYLAEAETDAGLLVQSLLIIWTGYRALAGLLRWATVGRRRGDAVRSTVYRPARRLLRVAAVWLAGWAMLEAAAYRADVVALWITVGHLVLVLGTAAILLRRERVLSLLPALENRLYRRFVAGLAVVYLPLVYFSLLVALLWVAGYQNLAGVFLGRSWAVVGLCLLAFAVYHAGVAIIGRWLPAAPETDTLRLRLFEASCLVLAAGVIGITLEAVLHVLGLLEPWRHSLALTWIHVGEIRITGGGLWGALISVVAGIVISRWVQAVLDYRLYPNAGVDPGEGYTYNRLVHYTLMALVTLLVLRNLGISPSSLAIVAGGLSVGIGLGLQNIANNIASGLILLTSRQVRQGDVISVGDQTGKVREVNLRSTLVTTFDNVDLIIPNSKLLGETLINWTHSTPVTRVRIPFGVAYGTDPAQVMEIGRTVGAAHPEVQEDPTPEVWLRRMADSTLEFELFVWIDMRVSNRLAVTSAIYCRLLEELGKEGIEIPFPQQDLHLKSGVPWEELIRALTAHAASSNGTGKADGEAPGAARSLPPAAPERL